MALDLAHRQALGADDFFVSRSNEQAVALVDGWPHWSAGGQFLIGPPASGKSHLVNVWRLRAGASMLAASRLGDGGALAVTEILGLMERGGALCVEDIDRGLTGRAGEEALFHLLNLAREKKGHILLTSRRQPAALDLRLDDLRSRLVAMPMARIDEPDDDLLMAVMVKLFADRQLEVEPGLPGYLLRRMERSFSFLAGLIDELDRASLASRRRIGKALAREVLARMAERQAESAAGREA
jgi:DnaA regulatory inactivator Hda